MRTTRTASTLLPALCWIVPAVAQEPAAAVPKAATASLYVTTVQDLRATFATDADTMLELPEALDPATDRFAGAGWDEPRVRAAKELATFALAARLPTADFGVAKDPMDLGYDEVRIHLYQLAQLTAAQGWHHLGVKEPRAAVHDAVTLLRHARHLGTVPSVFAGHAAFAAERHAAALLREIGRAEAALDTKGLGQLRTELDEHLQRRADRVRLVATVQEEVRRLLATTVRAAAAKGSGAQEQGKKPSPTDELVANRGVAIADRTEAVIAGWLAPLEREGDVDLAAALAEFDRQVTEAKRTAVPKEISAQLPKMSAEQAVEAVAKMFALMMCPRIKELLEGEARAAVELQECRRQLGDAPVVK